MVSLIYLTSDSHDDSHLCNSAAGPVDDYHLVILLSDYQFPPSGDPALLGPKLLLVMGCVKLGEKNCVHLPSVGEQTAN